jgi:hypothetical protein
MLANRADTYNLGEIIGGSAGPVPSELPGELLTSQSRARQAGRRSQKDVYAIIRMAEGTADEGIDLEGNYALAEINEMVVPCAS